MTIYAFMDEYCKDLIQESQKKKELVDLTDFPHDGIEDDADGKPVAVVYSGVHSIPVMDFFTLRREDFLQVWTHAEAAETFDNYVEGLIIIEGPEVINHIRNQILAEQNRLNHDIDLTTMI